MITLLGATIALYSQSEPVTSPPSSRPTVTDVLRLSTTRRVPKGTPFQWSSGWIKPQSEKLERLESPTGISGPAAVEALVGEVLIPKDALIDQAWIEITSATGSKRQMFIPCQAVSLDHDGDKLYTMRPSRFTLNPGESATFILVTRDKQVGCKAAISLTGQLHTAEVNE